MKQEHSRLEKVLVETITMLCKNSLTYSTELKIQGVVAVTIDTENVLVVHIDKALDALDSRTLAGPSKSFVKQEYPECSSTGRELVQNRRFAPADAVSNVHPMQAYDDGQDTEEVCDRNITFDDGRQQHNFDHSQDSENDVLIVEGRESEYRSNVKGEFEEQHMDTFRGPPMLQNYQEPRAISYEAMDSLNYTGASSFDRSQNCGLNLSLSSQRQSFLTRGSAGKRMRGRGHRRLSLSSPRNGLGRFPSAAAGPAENVTSFDSSFPSSANNAGPDSYSYGKVTVTNYVCNLCGVVYKHHCNLLTHQVRVHGRQKKRGAGRPPLRGQEWSDPMQSFD